VVEKGEVELVGLVGGCGVFGAGAVLLRFEGLVGLGLLKHLFWMRD
jgi:hypothetical protein